MVQCCLASISDTAFLESIKDLPRSKFSQKHHYVKIIQLLLPHTCVQSQSPRSRVTTPCSKLSLHHLLYPYNYSSKKEDALCF